MVITGSTKGLGLALARQFLALGDDVAINSRNGAAVAEVVQALKEVGRGGGVKEAWLHGTAPA